MENAMTLTKTRLCERRKLDATAKTAISSGSRVSRLGLIPVFLFAFSLFYTGGALAECGGLDDCIAVSIDAGVAPSHGTPLTSSPLAFGNQTPGTNSAVRQVFVGAVTGTNNATLTAITLGGADASQFDASVMTCTTGTASLVHGGAACTIDVTFNPTTGGIKNASLSIASSVITRVVPLTGFGDTGALPDPTNDANLKSQIRAQIDTTKRLAFSQIDNVQRRMEAFRHSSIPQVTEDDAEKTAAAVIRQIASGGSTDLAGMSGSDSRVERDGSINWWVAGNLGWGTREQTAHQVRQIWESLPLPPPVSPS